ncbi:hypothetical protein [Sanguibacter massiliensis]|uniref:hypothetical protein n=1 Tax=Sanguibacter massiliensis TaxID=1973217 RepID=UPI0013E9E3A1|nr:hypothetical protein [Sanguibacter massiliensis]
MTQDIREQVKARYALAAVPAEAFHVLVPAGRFGISDVVADGTHGAIVRARKPAPQGA